MLTEIYIEALLVDEELADHVREAWDVGEIDDLIALRHWLFVTRSNAGCIRTLEIWLYISRYSGDIQPWRLHQ